jgi:glucose dehydrogenase
MFYLGNDFSFHPGHGGWLGQLLAYNPVTQKPVWTVDRPLPWNGGTMTTAGNLVFQGDIGGVFHAYDAQSGKELWNMRLGSGIIAAPVTFAVGGKQYVAILTGRPQTMPSFMGAVGKQIIDATPQGGTLFVFGL